MKTKVLETAKENAKVAYINKNNRLSIKNYTKYFYNYFITYYRDKEGYFMAKKKKKTQIPHKKHKTLNRHTHPKTELQNT